MNFLITLLQNLLNSIFKNNTSENSIENQMNEIKKEEMDSIITIHEINDNIIENKEENNNVQQIQISSHIKEFSMITEKQFLTLFPKANPCYVDLLNEKFEDHNINTLERVSCFISQCGHESVGFTVFSENLNYSETGLLKVFKKYFNAEQAKEYARKPEKIANRVYANRMGNGPEESGDGWRFRGRGLIQLTGKNNYSNFAKFCNQSINETVTFCETNVGIVNSAVWFWLANGLNSFADDKNILGLTKKINGGTIGLEERKSLYNKTKELIKINF